MGVFNPGAPYRYLIGGQNQTGNSASALLADNTTYYLPIADYVVSDANVLPATGETTRQIVTYRSGVLKNLAVVLATAPGVGNTRTFTVRVNEANTTLTAAITGTARSGNDATNVVAVTAGQRISVSQVGASIPDQSLQWHYAFEFEGDA